MTVWLYLIDDIMERKVDILDLLETQPVKFFRFILRIIIFAICSSVVLDSNTDYLRAHEALKKKNWKK